MNGDPTVNAGNISVLTNWDLGQGTGSYDLATNTYSAYAGTYRVAATGEPGVLTLRAINDVVFDAAGISDGFYKFNQVGYSPYDAAYQTYRAQLYDYQIALANYDSNKAYFQGLGIGAPVAPTAPNYESYQSQVAQGPDSLLQESQMPASWGDSWSYRVVGGADFSSADPLSVQPVAAFAGMPGTAGSVILTGHRTYFYTAGIADPNSLVTDETDAAYSLPNASTTLTYAPVDNDVAATFIEPSILRTGTGSIEIVASVDVALTNPQNPDPLVSAAVYAAGQPSSAAPQMSPLTRVAVSGAIDPLYAFSGATGVSTLLTGETNPQGGGDIFIRAGRDVIGDEDLTDTLAGYQAYFNGTNLGLSANERSYIGQFWTPWLLAQPQNPAVPWYVNFGSFSQGVMSLGGNVAVVAGGDIRDFSVSLPTTAYISGSPGSQSLGLTGGGRLTVTAGGSIYSGSFYVGHGTGTIEAGGIIASDFNYFSSADPNTSFSVATLLAVQDGQISVAARQSVDIGGIYDPTYLFQPPIPGSNQFVKPIADYSYLAYAINSDSYTISQTNTLTPYVVSMTANSAAAIWSTAGSVGFNSLEVQGDLFAYGTQSIQSPPTIANVVQTSSVLLPASLSLIAFNGGLSIDHGGGLFPSANGTLTVIAGQTINLRSVIASTDGNVYIGNILSNVLELLNNPIGNGVLPTPLAPMTVNFEVTSPSANDINDPGLLSGEAGDTVRIYSLDGSLIDGLSEPSGTGTAELALVPNRSARINVAGNITDLVFYGQNVTASNTTDITAGGNIDSLPVPIGGTVFQFQGVNVSSIAPIIEVAGSGLLNMVAGGSITLTSQQAGPDLETGIRTIGNSLDTAAAIGMFGNPYLAKSGAAINVLFGVGPGIDDTAFVSRYMLSGDTAFAQSLIGFVAEATGQDVAGLTADQAWTEFQSLPRATQQVFFGQEQIAIEGVFFQILNQTSLDYNDPSSPYYHQYARGYQAINTLFPASLGYSANSLGGGSNGANLLIKTGTLDLRGSTIQTQQGGNISLIGPGGSILVEPKYRPPRLSLPHRRASSPWSRVISVCLPTKTSTSRKAG